MLMLIVKYKYKSIYIRNRLDTISSKRSVKYHCFIRYFAHIDISIHYTHRYKYINIYATIWIYDETIQFQFHSLTWRKLTKVVFIML